MIFYSKEINKPNSILEEVRDGIKIIDRRCIATFYNGKLETNDPKLILKLQEHPELFRTDRPWHTKENWKTTEEGIKLLAEGERLNIDCRHIRKEFLLQEIQRKLRETTLTPKGLEREKEEKEIPIENEQEVKIKEIIEEEPVVIKDTVVVKEQPKINYKELMKQAKKRGIKSFGVTKEALEQALKEVNVNV